MTTMDSDSESQDSDEGRRFRFEATRKDGTASLHSRKRRSSPSQTISRRRSRSRDRAHRDRRDADRPRRDHNKESQSNTDMNSSSKDNDTKYSKETNDSIRSSSSYRDSKDSRNSSNPKESKDSRESSFKRSRKESRLRERDKRRSYEHSTDRNYNEKLSDKYTNKFRDRTKRHSRERSRERSYQSSSTKITHLERSRDETKKMETLRRDDKERNFDDAERNVEKTDIVSKSDPNSRTSPHSPKQECKDLNLSDFDIVSDTEENSSDNSTSRQGPKQLTNKRAEDVLPYERGSSITKRTSKQQYERLLKKQAVKQHCISEESHKVKAKNNHIANNNCSAVSNSLLGDDVTTPTVSKLSKNNIEKSINRRKETSTSDSNYKQSIDTDSDNSHSSIHGPVLPPKTADVSPVLSNEINEKKEEKEGISSIKRNDIVPTAPRIIGPTLPAHLRQSIGDADMDVDIVEDTFGPALPPHLALQTDVKENSEDDDTSPILPAYEENKGESMERIVPDAETDDDDVIGPLPADHPDLDNDAVQRQLENRARRLKAELAMCDTEDEKKREEWMTELPPAQSANLGLGPRKFRVRPAPDMSDRSSWTDTPADRARKQMIKLENRTSEREPTISREQHPSNATADPEKSKKREKSLLEIHQKKLQKKKKKDEKEAKKTGKKAERRPFDREVDLQANHFDEARKKRMFLKARELDDRFSRGKI